MELNQLPQAGEGGAPINNPMPPLQWYYVNAEGNRLQKLRSEDIVSYLLKVACCFLYRLYSFKTSYDLSLHAGQQRGPVISRMILHKWHLGEIDGFTLVYSSLIGEWKKISDVDILKEAISKIAKEEQIGEGV